MSTKGIPHTSALGRKPKLITENKVRVNGKTISSKSIVPYHQVKQIHGRPVYQTIDFKGVPSNLLQSTSRFVGQIQQGSLTKINSATLRLRIRVNSTNSDCVLEPAPFWFDRIEIKAQNGSKMITKIYGDTNYFNLNIVDNDRAYTVKEKALLDPTSMGSIVVDRADQDELTIYLPLVGSVFGLNEIYFENSVGDLNVEFFPAGPTSVTQTAASSVDVLDMDLICQSEELHGHDVEIHRQHFGNNVNTFRFLEPIENHHYAKTVTEGQELRLDLDAITGSVSHLLVMCRPTSAVSSEEWTTNFGDIGSTTTVDVESNTGKSLFGGGTRVPLDYLTTEVFSGHFSSQFYKRLTRADDATAGLIFRGRENGVFVIPFCNNTTQSYHGIVDGCLTLKGERNYLSIMPSGLPAGVSGTTFDIKIYAYIYRQVGKQAGRYASTDDYCE